MVKDFPVEQVSSQYDIRHAVTEGAASWVLGMRLLGRHIGSLAVKDFTWKVESGKALIISVPLGEGIVNFGEFFALIRELGLDVPLSLHIEYPFFEKDQENLSLLEKQKIIVRKLKKDVDFIRQNLKKYELV
jgi:sugar phosphate isomerase/epimerase